ncbi:hypothetical protein [Blastococcus sp. Marseille-P5729]|uniref:hypothetical protein n=1 Tax=Blastococcus sp. Marseille-P5729 TaxID=2086582 RepID=UPI00131AC37B|nr:hypothetical protein [Blastococcus sp. Marseille-P5729]
MGSNEAGNEGETVPARTIAEAHVYMDLHPCACGATGFGRRLHLLDRRPGMRARYDGSCTSCGSTREFEFTLPAAEALSGPHSRFGAGQRPSAIIDAGQWMLVADAHAEAVSAELGDPRLARSHLETSAAATAEVMAFVDEDIDAVPRRALWTSSGLRQYDAEPGRFARGALEAVRSEYRDMVAGLDAMIEPR